MKLLYHAILALGEGCNTLLMSANSSKASFVRASTSVLLNLCICALHVLGFMFRLTLRICTYFQDGMLVTSKSAPLPSSVETYLMVYHQPLQWVWCLPFRRDHLQWLVSLSRQLLQNNTTNRLSSYFFIMNWAWYWERSALVLASLASQPYFSLYFWCE